MPFCVAIFQPLFLAMLTLFKVIVFLGQPKVETFRLTIHPTLFFIFLSEAEG